MNEVRTDYVALTATGVLIRTFADRDMAMVWSDVEGHGFPGHAIAKVIELTTTRTVILRRDRSHLRVVA